VKKNRKPGPVASATPTTADEVTERNIERILKAEQKKADPKSGDALAGAITRFCGSMTFVWVHVIWFGGWALLNLLLPVPWRWDPMPFPFLTLVVSLEAIFLSTFILITENREAARAARRAELDLQINLLAEQEDTRILQLLEKIAQRLGVEASADPETRALEEKTRPEKVLEQIDRHLRERAAE
jgi:uncharacterized membrane protein